MPTSPLFKKISAIFIAALICATVFSVPKSASAVDERAYVGTMSTFLTGITTSNNTPNISESADKYASIASVLQSRDVSRTDIINEVTPLHREIYALIEKAEGFRSSVDNNGGGIETDNDGQSQTRGAASEYEIFKKVDGWNLNEDTENLKNLGLYAQTQTELFTRLLELSKKYGDHSYADDTGGGTYQLFGMTEEYMQGVLDRSAYIARAVSSGLVIDAETGKPADADENFNSGRSTGSIEILNNQGIGGTDTNSDDAGGEGSSAIQCSFQNVDLQSCIAIGLYYGLLKPSSWVLWASGVAFNLSIDFTLNFGKFIRDQGLGTSGSGAIYLGWSAIRDLINVGFIFILLYAGIATILDLGGYGVKQTVIKVVIAALLLNFSLFFTKALIDMSNLVALQFYTRVLSAADQANSGSSLTLAGESQAGKGWDSGLSVGFINALGLKSIWTSQSNQAGGQANNAFGNINAGQMIIICLGGSAFILVTAFVLFMATIRFLYRSIVLIFLMILSPIGFVGDAIPQLAGPAKKWRGRLGNNLMFAPAYMAIFYVVALIVFGKNIGPSQVATNSGAGLTGFGALFKGDVSSAGLMFWFIMIIGLMIGTQIAADSFADKLDMADSFKKKAKGWAASFGNSAKGGFGLASAGSEAAKEAAGYAGRRAVGNTGIALSQNKLVQKLLVGTPLKNVGGQALYNKIGDLKDKKVGGYSLSDAKKAKEAKDEKTRDRLSEVSKPRTDEEKKAYEIRKGLEEVAARRAHLDQLGIAHSYHEEEQDADGKVTKVGKVFVGAEGTYKKDDAVGNQRAEKEEYDRADFEAKKIGGVIGSSMQAAIKKARTGNKGTVKGIEDQIDALAKEIVEMEHPAFVHITDQLKHAKKTAEDAYKTASSDAEKDRTAKDVMDAIEKLDKHTRQLNDKISRKERLERDKAIANSRATS